MKVNVLSRIGIVSSNFLTNEDEIRNLLDSVKIKNYTIFKDGIVDVQGQVNNASKLISNGQLVVKFGKVSESFYLPKNAKSLEGSPREVGGSFYCNGSKISSLEGCPEIIGHNFICMSCANLKTLKGNNIKKCRKFSCSFTPITSLEGCPQNIEALDCSNCKNLTSLQGAPRKLNGSFYCADCTGLTSLKGAPLEVGGTPGVMAEGFDIRNCSSLKTLEGAPKVVGGNFYAYGCTGLTSLKGAPLEVGGNFNCVKCSSLITLDGAPKVVGGNFDCQDCPSLQSLGDVMERVKGKFFFDRKKFPPTGYDNFNTDTDEVQALLKMAGVDKLCRVNAYGEVEISGSKEFKLPKALVTNDGKLKVKFNHCGNLFDCQGLLTSLEGCPSYAIKFDCSGCKIKTLQGAPTECRDFECKNCQELTSLRGAPAYVDRTFNCSGCSKLMSLDGAPKTVGEELDCSNCSNLVSLKGISNGITDFDCEGCKSLRSLAGIPETVKRLNCRYCNSLKDIDYLPKKLVFLACDKRFKDVREKYPDLFNVQYF